MHSDGRHVRFAWPDMPQNAKSISVLHSWPFVAERTPDADNVKVKSNERSSPLTRFGRKLCWSRLMPNGHSDGNYHHIGTMMLITIIMAAAYEY